jgi:hypothetical protein
MAKVDIVDSASNARFTGSGKSWKNTARATLLRQSYGIWLMGIVAVGLMVFGVYSLLSAAWFRLKK